MDCFGDHVLGCGHGPLRIKRHNAISEVIWHALLVDNKESKREQKCGGESNNRPGDVFHPDFLEGRPAFFDVSVRNSLQPSYVSKAAIKPGAAAEAGEIEKDEKHERAVTQAGGHFYPLIVETLGHWSPSSLETLKTIASKASSMNHIPFSQAYSNLMEQLSVRLWQYNAKLLYSRLNLDFDDLWDFPVTVM